MKKRKDAMEYKGYYAVPEYSVEDEVFYGKILGINDLVDFEAESVPKMKEAFKEAVDDYLEFCKEIGKEPEKTYSGCFNVRISSELHRMAAIRASALKVTLNRYVETAIENYTKNEGIRELKVQIITPRENISSQVYEEWERVEKKEAQHSFKTNQFSSTRRVQVGKKEVLC